MERNMQPVNTKMPLVNNGVSAFLTSRETIVIQLSGLFQSSLRVTVPPPGEMLLFHLAGEGTATRWLVPVVKFARRSTIINDAIVAVEQKNERGLGPVTNPTQTFFGSLAEKLSSRDKTFFTSKAITKFLAPLGKDKTKEILGYCLTPT